MKIYIKMDKAHSYPIDPILDNKIASTSNALTSEYTKEYEKSLQKDFPKKNNYLYFISIRDKIRFGKVQAKSDALSIQTITYKKGFFKNKKDKYIITYDELLRRTGININNIRNVLLDKERRYICFQLGNTNKFSTLFIDNFIDIFNIKLNKFHHITYIGKTIEPIKRPSDLNHKALTLTSHKTSKNSTQSDIFVTFFEPTLYFAGLSQLSNLYVEPSETDILFLSEKILTEWFSPEFNKYNTSNNYSPSKNLKNIKQAVLSLDISCDDNDAPNDYYVFTSESKPDPLRGLHIESIFDNKKITQKLLT